MINLIFALFVSYAFACDNKIPMSEAIKALNPPYSGHYKSCDELPDEDCLCWDNIEWHAAEMVDEVVDGDPIYSAKQNTIMCETEEKCEEYRFTLCTEEYPTFFYAQDTIGFEAYCVKRLGVTKIVTGKKILVNNEQKMNAYKAKLEDQAKQEKAIQEALLEREKGNRIVALFRSLNKEKNLNEQQKISLLTNSEIKNITEALSMGSLDVAKMLITAFIPDGTLVTQQDKEILLQELDK